MSRVAGLVSVIVPVYNRPRGLRDAVQSTVQQDYRPLEILIVDDGSSDDTGAVADELAHANPGAIRVLRQGNAGPGVAREHGRREARGEFLQYLDSDDVLLPGKLARQVAALHSHPEADIAYGWTRYRYADGSAHPTQWRGSGEKHETPFPAILAEQRRPNCGATVRGSLSSQEGSSCSRASPGLWAWRRKRSGCSLSPGRHRPKTRRHGLDFRLYQSAARVLGWALTGRIACWSDRLRSNDSRA